MRCFSQKESASWFKEHNLPADPYQEDGSGLEFYLQFYPPKNFRGVEAFTKALIYAAGPSPELFVSVTDTVMPWDFELRAFERLRLPSVGSLLTAPGHLFQADEVGDVVVMFSLAVAFQWKAYLYIPNSRSILYDWEGDIFDFWTNDRSVFDRVSVLLSEFKLAETKPA